MNPYIGHQNQLSGVEEYRLIGGKGEGMRLLQVRNGKGLEFTVSADRCADIARLSFRGINMSYFAPCGYVAPTYYDDKETGFLKSFTAGFLTTCGLNAVGSPCEDDGEMLPLHGTIGNTPAEHIFWRRDESNIYIYAEVPDEGVFSHKLVLKRTITCSLKANEITIQDEVHNTGEASYPVMLLYHMNMGYPLLSEAAKLHIPSSGVIPRNAHAKKDLDSWNQMIKPEAGFVEQCYFHDFKKDGLAAIYNPDIDQGLVISFDAEKLPFFTEWKMMGKRDYVLGLEPGNCHPDGRDQMRKEQKLTILEPGEKVNYEVKVEMITNERQWKRIKEA